MTLSEAIRLGTMLKPQGFSELLTDHGSSCALGAALDAVGGLHKAANFSGVAQHFPIGRSRPTPCPACQRGETLDHSHPRDLIDVVLILNDAHRWTRERIADWIEGIEAEQARPPDAAVAVTA